MMARSLLFIGGLITAAIGIALVFSPFESLAVLVVLIAAALIILGMLEVASVPGSSAPWLALVSGAAWLVAGVGVLAWPDVTVAVLGILVALGLFVNAVVHLFMWFQRLTRERTTALMLGIASLVSGVLIVAWPDITEFVIAVLFGARVIAFGLAVMTAAVRGETSRGPRGAPAVWRSRVRVTSAALALAAAVLLLAVSVFLRVQSPRPDAFYTAPDELPAEPGALLRAEPFTRGVPAHAQAWRILYTTTRDEQEPAVASGIVVAPRDAAPGPRPVIAWAHGTTGVASGCAPSLADDPFAAGATPALSEVIDNGWVMVATDYVGLGTEGPHPYVIGEGEGRSVLDSVRAARQLDDLQLADSTVVWGHSQGGHAALWTGILAPQYAPEVGVEAVAALSPASDLPALVSDFEQHSRGPILVLASFVVQAYSEIFDDVRFGDYVRPLARVPIREMAARCLAEPSVFVSGVESALFGQSPWRQNPAAGPLGERLRENVPTAPLAMPLLVGQGGADPLILPPVQQQFVRNQCTAGTTADYRAYDGRDHLSVVAPDSPLVPELLQWTADRFAGVPASSNCGEI